MKDWLPIFNSSIKPFVSTSMDAGARWRTVVGNSLKDTQFGLICVTRDNMDSRWLNFEAGAIGKELDDSHVIPLLYEVDETEVSGPLAQFQMKRVDKKGICDAVETINKYLENAHPADRFGRVFELCWPQLEADLERIDQAVEEDDGDIDRRRRPEDILAEVLTTTRAIDRRLNRAPVSLPSSEARQALLSDSAPRQFIGGRFRLPRNVKAAVAEIIELLPEGRVDGWRYLDHELDIQLSMQSLTQAEEEVIRSVVERHGVDLHRIFHGDP